MSNEIVLASNNAGKLKEFNALFGAHNTKVIAQSRFNVDDAIEDGLSFVENAIIKARHAAALTDHPSIADDSGLEVAALNGKPGIYSARFAGEKASDKQNYQLLLKQLDGTEQRQANFRCVMVFMRHAEDPCPIIAEGVLHGQIAKTPEGENGFGYDPVFYLPAHKKTCAQLSAQQKNQISHRALATRMLIKKMLDNQILSA